MTTLTEVKTIPLDKTETAAFVAAVKSVAMSASTDYARPILTGICIEIKDQQATLIATDSYRLTTVTLLPWPYLDGTFETTVILDAKQLVSAMPKGRDNFLSISFDNRQVVIGSAGGPSFTLPHIEGTYPAWRNLSSDKETKRDQHITIGLNPKLVASLMKSADTFRGKTDTPVKVLPALTEMKPLHMEMTVIDFGYWYSLLMPVRLT